MRYFLGETWAGIDLTVSFLGPTRNATSPMVFKLHGLLDLRRDAEAAAKRFLATATAALAKEKEEHERLASRWQSARATVERETGRLAAGPDPSSAAQGRAREGYLARLRDEAHRRKAAAEEHRNTALAARQAGYDKALAAFEKAVRDREALIRLKQRSQVVTARTAARKAEDAASDLAGRTRRRR
jgi:hypothetical protein